MSTRVSEVGNRTSGFDLLSLFQEEQENDFLALSQSRTIQPGEVLITEGEVPPGLFIITRGLFDVRAGLQQPVSIGDRKSTRLNSSHGYISYAVFCLKKKKKKKKIQKNTKNMIYNQK